MRLKFQIAFDILLITASCIILVYNFSVQRRIAYFASIVAVCGSTVYLIRDIMKLRKIK